MLNQCFLARMVRFLSSFLSNGLHYLILSVNDTPPIDNPSLAPSADNDFDIHAFDAHTILVWLVCSTYSITTRPCGALPRLGRGVVEKDERADFFDEALFFVCFRERVDLLLERPPRPSVRPKPTPSSGVFVPPLRQQEALNTPLFLGGIAGSTAKRLSKKGFSHGHTKEASGRLACTHTKTGSHVERRKDKGSDLIKTCIWYRLRRNHLVYLLQSTTFTLKERPRILRVHEG